MRRLHGLWHHRQLAGPEVLSLERELVLRPRLQDEIEGFLEALPALFLGDVVSRVVHRSRAASHPELQAPVAQDIGDGGLLGNLHGVVQGQQGDRGPQANARRPLGSRGQHHQRISQDREGPAEVKLAEPYGVEAQHFPELDLGHEVPISLALGIRARARQLIEEPETHSRPSTGSLTRRAAVIATRDQCHAC